MLSAVTILFGVVAFIFVAAGIVAYQTYGALRAWASEQIAEVLTNALVGSVGVITPEGLLDADGDLWALHPASESVGPEDVVVVVRTVGAAVVVHRLTDWAAESRDGSPMDEEGGNLDRGSIAPRPGARVSGLIDTPRPGRSRRTLATARIPGCRDPPCSPTTTGPDSNAGRDCRPHALGR